MHTGQRAALAGWPAVGDALEEAAAPLELLMALGVALGAVHALRGLEGVAPAAAAAAELSLRHAAILGHLERLEQGHPAGRELVFDTEACYRLHSELRHHWHLAEQAAGPWLGALPRTLGAAEQLAFAGLRRGAIAALALVGAAPWVAMARETGAAPPALWWG